MKMKEEEKEAVVAEATKTKCKLSFFSALPWVAEDEVQVTGTCDGGNTLYYY